jgi:hypothetical protein
MHQAAPQTLVAARDRISCLLLLQPPCTSSVCVCLLNHTLFTTAPLLLPTLFLYGVLSAQEQFAVFIAGVCDDFGMSPGSSITQDQFMAALKAQLRAAAGATSAAAAAAAAATGVPAKVAGTPKAATPKAAAAAAPQQKQYTEDVTAGADAHPTAAQQQQQQQQLTHTSAFAAYSSFKHEVDDTAPAQETPSCPAAAAVLPALHAAAEECKQAGGNSAGCKQAAAAIFRAAAEDPTVAEAAATLATASSAEMDAAAAACAAEAAAGASACPNLNTPAYSPGMLTCAAARLRQNALLRQTSLKRPPPAAAAAAGHRMSAAPLPPAAAADNSSIGGNEAMQQVAKYRQALSRFRAASKVVLAANASAANGLQQLKEARQLRTASQMCNAAAGGMGPAAAAGGGGGSAVGGGGMGRLAGQCSTLDEARSLCLNQLADFLMMQHLQVRSCCSMTAI